MKAVVVLIAFLTFLFYLPSYVNPVFAARSLTISANKDSLFGDEEVAITASASGFTNGETIYLKGAFYQDTASPNYFGYTKSGDSWIKNSTTTLSQRSIKIGEWDGSIISKSDFTDSGYKGEGGYKFKIGFYYLTSGGNLSAVNWSANVLDINLNEPDPTPTNTPSPTPSSTPTSSPTDTPIPTKTPTPTPNHTPTPTLKPSVTQTSKIPSTEILGEGTDSGIIVDPTKIIDKEEILIADSRKKSNSMFMKFFIFLGTVTFAATCGILAFKHFRKERADNE